MCNPFDNKSVDNSGTQSIIDPNLTGDLVMGQTEPGHRSLVATKPV